ncbi:proteasome assembly factor, putative [Entamoeba histolytica HM-3:IMSS]|uniref:Proteasome assembly chaperone 2 n=2 Tax=Entamoeba histolytica TaxID=5759 RepID=M2RXZ8_ENTHI|nr:Hypothetical protein EHI5A_013450 [Entamoeba histolytica KU27]EMS15457.1 proteasome assembly factor, putative [Entamoeba histolytica HM-3:IMSS]
MKTNSPFNNFNKILFIPCWSVGNVGQLCADLIINSLELKQQVILQHEFLIPYVAPPIYDHIKSPTFAATIYGNEEMNVIQLRSTFIASRYLEFCRDFAECIKSLQPSEVIFLYSSSKGELGDILFSSDKVIEKSPITKELYSTLSKSNLKCKIVHCTCYEGDNRPDAIQMYSLLKKEYQWNKEIKQVQSWNNSTLWGELDEDVRAVMF